MNALGVGVPINKLVEFSADAHFLDFLEILKEGRSEWISTKFAKKLQKRIRRYENLLFNISCESDKLIVKGEFIFISDIIEGAECWSSANSIEIYAVDRVFIDADIDKAKHAPNLTIISPIWEVIPPPAAYTRRILLSGKDANKYEIPHENRHGEPGSAGRTGGTGGNFVGIGSSFVDDERLEIVISGGNGGDGQDGGNGKEKLLNSGYQNCSCF